MTPAERNFLLARFWLMSASLTLGLLSLSWPIFGSLDPSDFYLELIRSHLLGTGAVLSDDTRKVFGFAMVLVSAASLGFFTLLYLVLRYPFRYREAWAFWAVWAGLAAWLMAFAAFSLYFQAWFNLLYIGVPVLLIFGIPLPLAYKHYFRKDLKEEAVAEAVERAEQAEPDAGLPAEGSTSARRPKLDSETPSGA